jgi:tryptophanyl-tRNA synthetase
METALLMMAVILVTALVLVLIPVGVRTDDHLSMAKPLIRNPALHQTAEVMPKAWYAALMTALARKPILRVKSYSLWPKKMGCEEKCIKENWPTP